MTTETQKETLGFSGHSLSLKKTVLKIMGLKGINFKRGRNDHKAKDRLLKLRQLLAQLCKIFLDLGYFVLVGLETIQHALIIGFST